MLSKSNDYLKSLTSIENRLGSRVEFGFLILFIGLASFLWSKEINLFPGGLHYDEAIDLWGGKEILAGNFSIYIERGWGRESLYYYPLAAVLMLVENNWLALKITAIGLSIGTGLTSYFLFKPRIGALAAAGSLGWYIALYWVYYISRSGNRAVILPFMISLTTLIFWKAWDGPEKRYRKIRWFSIAGVSLGLTWYTYQPARFVPFLFGAFFIYCFVFHRPKLRENFEGLCYLVFLAALMALPLAYFLSQNPQIEGVRNWTIQPFSEMMMGNFGPISQNIVATFKMFSFSGDPLVSYNVPNRPVFLPAWSSVFFYIGLLHAIWNWRKPFYFFMILWLGVLLAPTILTISAPNHLRASGAIPAIIFFAGLSFKVILEFISQFRPNRFFYLPVVLFFLFTLIRVGNFSNLDYFDQWAEASPNGFNHNYNVRIGEIVRHVQADQDLKSFVISSHSIEDAHPTIVDVTLEREDLTYRWVDASKALVMPNSFHQTKLILAEGRWINDNFGERFGSGIANEFSKERFTQLNVTFPDITFAKDDIWLLSTDVQFSQIFENKNQGHLPVSFENLVRLNGIEGLPLEIATNSELAFFTWWEVDRSEIGRPIAIFVHLIDSNGNIVAQQDGLGYPLHSWQPGDAFIHVHELKIPEDLPEATYWIQMGIYEKSSGARWRIFSENDLEGDRIILSPVEIKK